MDILGVGLGSIRPGPPVAEPEPRSIEADARATFADWHITGVDLGTVMENLKGDPSLLGEESKQLSLFTLGGEITRELQETA